MMRDSNAIEEGANPDGLAKAREFFRPLYVSREFWLLIVDVSAMAIPDRIARKYYDGADTTDWAAIPAVVNDDPFVVVAMRKRRMLGYQLNSLLRQMAGIKLTDREIVARDLFILADPKRLEAGTHLAVTLFDDPNAERGDAGAFMYVGRYSVLARVSDDWPPRLPVVDRRTTH